MSLDQASLPDLERAAAYLESTAIPGLLEAAEEAREALRARKSAWSEERAAVLAAKLEASRRRLGDLKRQIALFRRGGRT